MASEFELPEAAPRTYIESEGGSRLYRLSRETYQAEERHALTPARLHDGQIYRAHGTSRQLEANNAAVAFDVLVRSPQYVRDHLAVMTFKLVLLDADYQQTSEHAAGIDANGYWHIPAPFTPIYLVQGAQELATARINNKLKDGYLLEHDDSTLEDIIHTPRYEDTPFYNALKNERDTPDRPL